MSTTAKALFVCPRSVLEAGKAWEEIEAAAENKDIVEGVVTEENKGGIVVNAKGIRVFVPASQSGVAKGGDLGELVKKTVQLRITEVNRARRRVVGSIRSVASEQRKAAQEKIWSEIEVGKQYHGTVKSLTSYGAFVDIGGVDGMVHVSELSWNRIKNPAEVVKVGDEIDVFVIALDPEKKKISLGYKTEATNPWTIFNNEYKVGDVVTVKIVKLMTFGAFAEIIPGVDGLIHISQIADRRIGKPEDVLSEGQEVDAKIIDIDQEHKRISFSIRALLAPADEDEEKRNKKNLPGGRFFSAWPTEGGFLFLPSVAASASLNWQVFARSALTIPGHGRQSKMRPGRNSQITSQASTPGTHHTSPAGQ